MQDIAGMRIAGAADRNEQEAIVAELVEMFQDAPRAPKVIDRRENPSHGYRAVHVIVFPDDMAVEIQVRTRWQHEWADMFEKFADRVGRDIRYGAPPEHWLTERERSELDPLISDVYDASYRLHEATVGHALALANLISVVEQAEVASPGTPALPRYRLRIAGDLDELREDIELLDRNTPGS